MAEDYTQGTRPMTLSKPFGEDKLLLVGFERTEVMVVDFGAKSVRVKVRGQEFEVPPDRCVRRNWSEGTAWTERNVTASRRAWLDPK